MRAARWLGALVIVALACAGAGRGVSERRGGATRGGEVGLASYYGERFHGRRTASGERHDREAFTCAHPTAPFGTRLRVTDLATGRSVVVRVNDRGPFVKGRVIDLSLAAARSLGIVGRGLARVRVEPEGE